MIEVSPLLGPSAPSPGAGLLDFFQRVRQETEQICKPLETEDYQVQPSSDVSPPKWHLGHTSWFFEEMILIPFKAKYKRWNKKYPLLFNSYYKSAGTHWLQGERGHLSRPTVEEVYAYRHHVNKHIEELISLGSNPPQELSHLMHVGIHHEKQHQELLFMDIKYIFGFNPMQPAYVQGQLRPAKPCQPTWTEFSEGLFDVGHQGEGFAYDNESPKHQVYLYPFSVCDQAVTNGQFLEFIEAGGYQSPEHWLSQGWEWVCQNAISHPLYWNQDNKVWFEYTLYGPKPLCLEAPVCHLSYFEAEAFARWKDQRLPTEQELEVYLASRPIPLKRRSPFQSRLHSTHADSSIGELWWWTRSHYSPYPKYRSFKGKLTEYNGKFMCNQFVLKGGCFATPLDHYRHTYRNFYSPEKQWMFSGLKLARDI